VTVTAAQTIGAIFDPAPPSTAPYLALSPTIENFGSVTTGTTVTATVQISNTAPAGGQDLKITSASIANTLFAVPPSQFPMTIAAGSTQPMSVSFSPQAVGAVSGTVNFASNASNQSTTLPVTGTGSSTVSNTLDGFGGRLDLSCTATGWFHTEKLGDRWWLCTPLGHGFFKTGINMVQPSGYYNVTTRYGSMATWANMAVQRIKSWGFNTVDSNHSDYAEATSTIATKVPFIPTFQPEGYAMTNAVIYDTPGYYSRPALDHAVKSLFNAMPASFYNSNVYNTKTPDLYDDGIYTLAETFMTHKRTWQGYASSANQPYLIGVVLGEIDNLFPLEAGDLNGANPNPSEHLSWVVLAGSPVQTAGAPNNKWSTADNASGIAYQFYYTDTETKSKAAFRNFLQARYAPNPPACALSGHTGIQALNDCWGSTYTSFNSTGTQVTGETVATGDGRTTAYSYTLAQLKPSRFSLQVAVNGTVIAGELHHDNGNGTAAPGNTTSGRLWGTYVTGTVTWGTGAISATFKTTTGVSRAFAQISTDGATVTVHTMYQHGLWRGANVTISGTTNGNYDGSYTVTSVADPYHFSYAKPGSYAASATGTYALAAVPGSGDIISVNYVANGWEFGTGFMDEANNHSWSNKDATTRKISLLASAQMRTDLDDFLEDISYYFFSNCKAKANAAFPNLMYLGPGATGTHGWPSRGPILKAAARIDMPIMFFGYGLPPSQAGLDYVHQYAGDRAFAGSFFATANADSPWAGYAENTELYYPTQAAKGQGYYDVVNSLLSASTNGVHPYIGLTVWGYYDHENKNWGITTRTDNAYDGHEAVIATGACSPPLGAYTCGGEAGNYGDVITKMKEANALWLTIR
jgi:hypothetical protein